MRLISLVGLLGGLLLGGLISSCSDAITQEAASPIEIKAVMIPMPDGVNLAADLYMPADLKPGDNIPVILEYSPYRKMESRGGRYKTYSYFVEHGYVIARVDIRGTGNSEGHVIPYEYSDIELDDGGQMAMSACLVFHGAALIQFKWLCVIHQL